VSRSQRLLALLRLLRRHRHPVAGVAIAQELGISLRTLCRDVATLQAQGAPIDGAPGLGYVLPAPMFSVYEIDALVLGTRWIAQRGDARLRTAARDAMAKIAAVVPPERRRDLETCALLVAINCDGQDCPPALAGMYDSAQTECVSACSNLNCPRFTIRRRKTWICS